MMLTFGFALSMRSNCLSTSSFIRSNMSGLVFVNDMPLSRDRDRDDVDDEDGDGLRAASRRSLAVSLAHSSFSLPASLSASICACDFPISLRSESDSVSESDMLRFCALKPENAENAHLGPYGRTAAKNVCRRPYEEALTTENKINWARIHEYILIDMSQMSQTAK